MSCLGNSKGRLVSSKSYLILCLLIRKSSSADVSYVIRGDGFALLILSCLGNCKGDFFWSKSYLILCLFLHIRKHCRADVSDVIRGGGGFALLIGLSW